MASLGRGVVEALGLGYFCALVVALVSIETTISLGLVVGAVLVALLLFVWVTK